MAVVGLAVLLHPRRVQACAVGDDDVVPAVGRGIPGRLVLAHEEHGDAAGEAAEGGRRYGLGRSFHCAESRMWCCGRDVVPYS